ncbi:MAG: sigma-70 family RNA polymerase sigma factor [Phaeodactylibacter sp.]|nr:sigma-70 family RNA polymerase sigma factor [Phaeodactylibacter sp.]
MKNFLRLSTREEQWEQASDEALLRAYRQTGNRELAAELFNRYVHLVYAVCRQYLKDREDCRDAVMAVFEQTVTQARSTEIQHFSKWLYSTAKNRCISNLRDGQRNSRQQEEWENYEKNEPKIMENEGFLRLINERTNESNTSRILEAAISGLEEGQRTCIRLFFYDKKRYKEIAGITGYSEKQVKSFLQNGKRRLRAVLAQKLEESS